MTMIVAHNKGFSRSDALYPFQKSDVNIFGIPKGNYDFSRDGPFNGEIPNSLIVGFVLSEAYSGS